VKSILKIGFLVFLTGLIVEGNVSGQTPELLRLRNKSFDAPTKYFVIPPAWYPQKLFLAGKNIKELRLSRFYRKEEKSQKGNTHVALATYANGVRENIGQRLDYPMISGHRYQIEFWLAWSPVRTTVHPIQSMFHPETGLRPVKIQLFGFYSQHILANSLLAETTTVDHLDWKKYTLEWNSPGKFEYFYLVATWVGDEYYNGNILLDNVSDIKVMLIDSKK